MLPLHARLLAPLVALALLASPAPAQKPTKGDWWEDTQQVGFRVRSPKDWRYVPPQPDEADCLAKFVPENNDSVLIHGWTNLKLYHWVLHFDLAAEREELAERTEKMFEDLGVESFEDLPEEMKEELEKLEQQLDIDQRLETWCERNEPAARGYELVDEDEIKLDKDVVARELIFEGTTTTYGETEDQRQSFPIRVYMALVEVRPDEYIGLTYNSLGEKSKYKKAERYFTKMVKTFELQLLPEAEATESGTGPKSAREEKRVALQAEIGGMPGWWMTETDNYFVLTDSEDEGFIDELCERLEAIRSIYEVDYPAEKARRVVEGAELASEGPGEAGGEEGEGAAPGQDPERRGGGSVVAKDDLDKSRLSVVRVCSDRDMYFSYGGPPSSAGYWSSRHEELVIFDDRKRGGRRNTWAVLNHEAFHQYIFYFYGSIAPHSWYNEGTGDFYSGYEFNSARKNFKLKEFDWRRDLAKQLIREETYIPLNEIVYWSQREYYGRDRFGNGGGEHYAQGWSFIFFLRQGKGKPKKWNDAWDEILDVYLDELAKRGDLDGAVDVAFEGVDWSELEEAWKDYMG